MLTRDRLGALFAVFFGTAVVALTLTLLSSASPQIPDRFAAVVVAVQSPSATTPADPFPQSRPWPSAEAVAMAGRLSSVPGVTAAVPDRTFYAQPVVAGQPAARPAEGHGWASALLAPDPLGAGRAATGDREVVVDRALGVAVGADITILTATGPSIFSVTGLISSPRLYFSDAMAQRLSPGVRVIGMTGRPDLAAVKQVTGEATVVSGASRGSLEPRDDARTRWIGTQVLSAMAALSAFGCVFVIASTFAFSVNTRRREIGLLRAVGATPRQVRWSVLREAAAVGSIAALAGTAAGVIVAPAIGRVLVSAGFEPPSYDVGLHVWPVLAGLAAGPVVAVTGALIAAGRAARVGPLEALRRAEVETRPMTRPRWIAGAVVAVAGAVAGMLTVVTDDLSTLATYALLGAMALVTAGALLAPAVVPPLVRALMWPARGPLGMLVRESALAGARRTASTAAPVLLTVAFAMFIAGNVQTSASAYADRRADTVRAGAMLVPDGTPGLTDAVSPDAPLPTDVYIGTTVVSALGVDPRTAAATLPGIAGAAQALTAPDSVLATRSRMQQLGLTVGNTIDVTLADGNAPSLRIAGVLPDGSVPADLVIDRAAVRAHDPSALAAAMPLPLGSAATRVPGARTVDVATWAREADSEEDRLVWIFTLLLIGVSVGYGALAVANTLVMATVRRAPDYRLLRLAGATPRQVLITVAAESAVVVAIGSLIGGSAALLALWGTVQGLRAQTGTSVDLVVPWSAATAAVSVCLVLALLASVLPARSRLIATALATTSSP